MKIFQFIKSELNIPEEESDLSLAFKHQNSSGCQTQTVLITISCLQGRDGRTGKEKKWETFKQIPSYIYILMHIPFTSCSSSKTIWV